jgi:toxin ParE1/3/4
MRITYSRHARRDLDQIWIHVAKESKSTDSADRLLDSIRDTCNRLGRSPYIGRKRDEDLASGMRSIPCGNYLIFYRVNAGTVRIVRVLHGMRDMPTVFREQ